MPLYEYRCQAGHTTERLRRYIERDRPLVCPECDQEARRIPSAHYRQPDGIYSHDENIGRPELVEKAMARERGERWDALANPKRPE